MGTPSDSYMKLNLNEYEDHKVSNVFLLGYTTMKYKWS